MFLTNFFLIYKASQVTRLDRAPPSIKQSPDLINVSLQQKTRTSSSFIVCHAPYFRSFPLHGRPSVFSIAKLRCCMAPSLPTLRSPIFNGFLSETSLHPADEIFRGDKRAVKGGDFRPKRKKGLFPVCVRGSEGRTCGRDYRLPSDGSSRK